MSVPADKEVPVFKAESIAAMSPLERMIADEMTRAGWIKIVNSSEQVVKG